MKTLILEVSLKYGIILGALNLVVGLIDSFMPNSQGIVFFVLLISIPMAHYEYNKKNGYFISFKDAILLGIMILGIFFITLVVYSYIDHQFISQEKPPFYLDTSEDLSGGYGMKIRENLIFLGSTLLLSLFQFLAWIVALFLIITVEAKWKVYRKAGKPGWAVIIPIYNTIVLLQIIKKPIWWLFMLLIPFVNIIFVIWMTNLLSKRFNKDEGFTVGLILIPFIFYPLLGMSRAEYIDE